MTKKSATIRVWHPVFKAWANPRKADLALWQAQGWVVTPEPTTPKE